MKNETNKIIAPRHENVDPKEIAKFEIIATRWWDLDGEFKILHRINFLRLDYILERARGIFGKTILDVGCGGGILSENMARLGAKVTGLDMGVEALTIARLHAFENGVKIEYRQQTLEEHAKTHHGTYDVVTCMEMLEHVPDPASIVRTCSHLIKPGGKMFFSTINRNLKAWLLVIIGAEYVLRIVPLGTHDIKKFIKPAELLSWVDDIPLCEQHIIGVHYSPLWNRFYLSKGVDVNYILYMQQ